MPEHNSLGWSCRSVCVQECVCLPGGGGLGLDCNDNGEEFK